MLLYVKYQHDVFFHLIFIKKLMKKRMLLLDTRRQF